jgi:signal transduction histidine kinase/DNA-binding response OmpR family regulator/HAMP domain-containing protein
MNKLLRQPRKFKASLQVRIVFGSIVALALAGLLWRFNYQDEEKVQWLQMGLIVGMMLLGLLEISRSNRTLKHLAEVADQIGQGHYDIRAEVQSRDALGTMAQALNSMADQVAETIRQREQARTELESSQKVLANQNEQLTEAFERQTRFGRFLTELTSVEISILADRALDHIMLAANAPLAAFYLHDAELGKLQCLGSKGVDQQPLKNLAAERGLGGLPGEVLRRKEWVYVEDPYLMDLMQIDVGIAQVPLRCVFGLPVVFRNKVLGVLILACLRRPDEHVQQDLNNHVDALANGLNNALSYKALNRQSLLLEKANQKLRTVDQLRSEFVANMSHELRTPLNSIIGFSGILLKNRGGNLSVEDVQRAEKINRNGKHLLRLINDILDLSKIEAGRMELNLETTGLNAMCREIADLLHPQAEAKGIFLKVELPAQEQVIETDPQKLRQILINLAGNAIKFTRQGSVTLRLEPAELSSQRAILRVEDTGIGIPDDKLGSIFEAFRQADNSTTREFGGTGLGLTISRSFVQMMGGTLTVSSEVGKGSVFTIKVPITRAGVKAAAQAAPAIVQTTIPMENGPTGEQAAADTENSEPAASGPPLKNLVAEYREILGRNLVVRSGQNVLVVDDDPDARELLAQYVQDLGARAILCANASQAIRMAMEHKPELITLDLVMSEKSGWDVLTALKSEPSICQIPVVIVSIVADRRRALSLGAVDALTKPVTRADFNGVVSRCLGIRQGEKILVIEDQEDARALMSSWLQPHVAELKFAINGQVALEMLKSWRPDIIFLDLNMPVMDGTTFLERLRADPEFATLPVIVLTSRVLEESERQRLGTQVAKVLLKSEVFA